MNITKIINWILGTGSRPSQDAAERPVSINSWADGFSLNIVGESRCQSEIKQCRVGESVRLVREPNNPHDDMAVRVLSARGKGLGYLSRDRARWLGRKMDAGATIKAQIERITGGGKGASLGILLKVWLNE